MSSIPYITRFTKSFIFPSTCINTHIPKQLDKSAFDELIKLRKLGAAVRDNPIEVSDLLLKAILTFNRMNGNDY